MRVKSRNPEAAKLQHLLAGLVGQVVGGAADGEREQMRQMRNDRQHAVVMRRFHPLGHRPAAAPQFGDLLHRSFVGAGGGVSSVQRPWNSVVKPESGPEYSVPANGCAGTKCTPAGTNGPTSRITDCLVDPTSVSTAPGCKMRRNPLRQCRRTRQPGHTA